MPPDQASNAIGTLLFQAIRGIKGQVNSRSAEVIQPLLSMDCQTSLKIVDSAFSRLFDHLQRDHAQPVVEWLLCSTSQRAVHFIETFVRYRSGILVPDVSKFVEFTTKLDEPQSQITIISLIIIILACLLTPLLYIIISLCTFTFEKVEPN